VDLAVQLMGLVRYVEIETIGTSRAKTLQFT